MYDPIGDYGGRIMEHWVANAALAVKPWLDGAGTMLTSWLAWRIYALAGGVFVAGLSIWNANRHREFVVEISSPPGRKPSTRKSILRWQRQLAERVGNKQREAVRQAILVLFYGFFIPSTVLGLAIYFYPRFMPGQDALSVSGCPHPLAVTPTFFGTGAFIFSQLAMGMANKMSFLADSALARAFPVYMPANEIVAVAMVGYRYFIGLFAAAFVHLLYTARKIPADPMVQQQKADLEKRMEKADH
jgi:hypothetical protein